jgi:hypothetical protein
MDTKRMMGGGSDGNEGNGEGEGWSQHMTWAQTTFRLGPRQVFYVRFLFFLLANLCPCLL